MDEYKDEESDLKDPIFEVRMRADHLREHFASKCNHLITHGECIELLDIIVDYMDAEAKERQRTYDLIMRADVLIGTIVRSFPNINEEASWLLPSCIEYKNAVTAFRGLMSLKGNVSTVKRSGKVAKLPPDHPAVSAYDQGIRRLTDAINALTRKVETNLVVQALSVSETTVHGDAESAESH